MVNMEVLKDFITDVQVTGLPKPGGSLTAKMKAIAYYLTGRTFKLQAVTALTRNRLYVKAIAEESQVLRRHGFRS